ncbi:potassium/proton antiporter [Lutibaculum baratangense]|uniref:Sodium/hydrogen exchanger n=1 Tax=Lutibaculum baratangense AMV1 TaxID=631454 RepID=V4REN4_9HYPH|nr:potassium/proton antiporter [Lutibaculum baratangense]ESR24601.1 sodium/hydrogen exchanger [Lutibaculum baratangense AMV1]
MFDPLFVAILIGSSLLVLAVATSLIAFRIGAPLLLVFLALGLAVGEDGLGLDFDNAGVAYSIGSVALVLILFDAGFNTRTETLRRAAWPALTLSTVGVVMTTCILAAAVHLLFDLDWLPSLLLGAIVSSTDAAAVFFLLRIGGVRIRERVRATLEVESGSNDPVAVFSTLALLGLIATEGEAGAGVLTLVSQFVLQMGLGAVGGYLGGHLIGQTMKRLQLEAGLYPVLVLGLALMAFATTSLLGGSGFLAAYVAGLVSARYTTRATPMLRRFQEGLTWLSQIVMFLLLGLLATPSHFGAILLPGLITAAILILVARPLAVTACLLPFGFSATEIAFVSWVGLRGAVSILLAIAPILAGLDVGQAFFNIAFIIVLTSLVVQGWSIRPLARRLGLVVPPTIGPVEKVELELPGHATHELIVYRVVDGSPVSRGERLPRWARPSLVVRDNRSMRHHEAGRLAPGDLVYIFSSPRTIRLLDRLFASPVAIDEDDTEYFGEFVLQGDAPLAAVAHEYGMGIEAEDGQQTIGQYLSRRLGADTHRGDRIAVGRIELIVRDLSDDGAVTRVGLSVLPATRPSPIDRVRRPVRWRRKKPSAKSAV